MKVFVVLLASLGLVQNLEQHNTTNILTVHVISGNLNQEVDGFAKAWVLDSKEIVLLPITKAKLANLQYIEITSLVYPNRTKTPDFNITLAIPMQRFTDQSNLAVEVYNNATLPPTYIGGRSATVGQLKQLPHSYTLELLNASGSDAGAVDISWD